MSNKNFHKAKKPNPALNDFIMKNKIKKYLDEARASGVEYAVITYHIISIMVLVDKLGLTDEQLDKYNAFVNKSSESITEDYVTIPDMIKALKEEYNFTDERLLKYYPGLEAYMEDSSSDDKK